MFAYLSIHTIGVASSPAAPLGSWRTTIRGPASRKAGTERLLSERGRIITRYHPDSDAAARHATRQAEARRKRQAQANATSTTSTAELALIDENADQLYQASVLVGTPPVAYSIVLDTGSGDFFLLGTGCPSCTKAETTDHRYAGSKSSSFQQLNESFSAPYGSGSVNETLGMETVTLGGFTVQNQVFG